MLTWIRKKSSGVFMTIIMGILILAFALWGVGDYFTQSSNDSLATVNGETIKYSDFNSQFNRQIQSQAAQFGEGFDISLLDTPMQRRNFLETMIQRELLMQAANSNGFALTPDQIKQTISQYPVFQGVDGQFDPTLYANFLAQTNQSAQMLEQEITQIEAITSMVNLVEATNFVTPGESEQMAKLNKQTRDLDYISINQSKFIDDVEVSDEEIQTHYDTNTSRYMTEEMVSVNFIELDANTVAASIEISDEDAQVEYDKNPSRFEKPEQRLASHILLSDDGTAEDLLKEIQDKIAIGEDFAELAKTYSKDPGSADLGGDLGWVSPTDMVEEFDEALFAMSQGDISEPVKTQFGYHLIQLNEIKAATISEFEEVEADIIQELQAIEAETLFLDKVNELAELVIDAQAGLESVAEDAGYPLQTTELFSRRGGLGVAANQEFIQSAFSSTVKDELLNSDVINLSDTHVVFLHLNENQPAAEKPLDEVKETIVSTLKSEKAREKAEQLAAQLVEELATPEADMKALAEANDLVVVEARDVTRTGSSLPFGLAKNVFEAGRPEMDQQPVLKLDGNAGEVAVVKLLAVNEVDLSNIEDLSAESAQLNRNINNNEQSLMIKALQEAATITINEELLNQASPY